MSYPNTSVSEWLNANKLVSGLGSWEGWLVEDFFPSPLRLRDCLSPAISGSDKVAQLLTVNSSSTARHRYSTWCSGKYTAVRYLLFDFTIQPTTPRLIFHKRLS